jgi:hypothetical protein
MESDNYKKEYSLTEIISNAWKVFRDNPVNIIAIMLLIGIPVYLINYAANQALAPSWMTDPTTTSDEFTSLLSENMGQVITSFLLLGAIAISMSFISLLSSMALAFYVKACVDGKKIDLSTAYSKAFGRWPAAIYTNIIEGVLLLLLFLLIIIPGLIYSIYWTFALYAVALSGKSGKEALDYSKTIVKNRWWTVLGYTLVFGLIGLVLSIPLIILIGVLRWALTDQISIYAIDLTSTVLSLIIASFLAVIQIVFYINYESTIRTDAKKY